MYGCHLCFPNDNDLSESILIVVLRYALIMLWEALHAFGKHLIKDYLSCLKLSIFFLVFQLTFLKTVTAIRRFTIFSKFCDHHVTFFLFFSHIPKWSDSLQIFGSLIVCLWTWFCPNFNSKIFSTWWDPSSNPLFSTAHTDVQHCLRQLLP